jgi:DNA-binding LacI/PurR family transcriptional regulator
MIRVTIKEVALAAGVSTATVSRVINNNYPVSEDVRKKVSDIINELNYERNEIARSLKSSKSYMIGIVVSDILNPYFMSIAKGVESFVNPHGYNLIFCSSDENREKELNLLKLLSEKRVDAIVLASCNYDAAEINEIIKKGVKIIVVDSKIPGVHADTIVEDGFSGAYSLINHVIGLGHKKIAVVNGSLEVSTGKERFAGYKTALENNKLELKDDYIAYGNFKREDAYLAVKDMLERNKNDLPTTIFTSSNFMAEGTIIAIKELGLRIPEDISVVSFGNISVPALVQPALTYVSQDAFAIGCKAGEILLRELNSSKTEGVVTYKEYVLVPQLIVGESVKKLE